MALPTSQNAVPDLHKHKRVLLNLGSLRCNHCQDPIVYDPHQPASANALMLYSGDDSPPVFRHPRCEEKLLREVDEKTSSQGRVQVYVSLRDDPQALVRATEFSARVDDVFNQHPKGEMDEIGFLFQAPLNHTEWQLNPARVAVHGSSGISDIALPSWFAPETFVTGVVVHRLSLPEDQRISADQGLLWDRIGNQLKKAILNKDSTERSGCVVTNLIMVHPDPSNKGFVDLLLVVRPSGTLVKRLRSADQALEAQLSGVPAKGSQFSLKERECRIWDISRELLDECKKHRLKVSSWPECPAAFASFEQDQTRGGLKAAFHQGIMPRARVSPVYTVQFSGVHSCTVWLWQLKEMGNQAMEAIPSVTGAKGCPLVCRQTDSGDYRWDYSQNSAPSLDLSAMGSVQENCTVSIATSATLAPPLMRE